MQLAPLSTDRAAIREFLSSDLPPAVKTPVFQVVWVALFTLGPDTSTDEIAALLGISTNRVRHCLRRLRTLGVVAAHGEGHWAAKTAAER